MALTDPVIETLFRFAHILAGITWIGLLYFFNLVNLPLLKFPLKKPVDVNMGDKASAHVTMKTLFWFRWGAMFTLIFGLLLVYIKGSVFASHGDYFFNNGPAGILILMGVVLGIVMWFNVWFIIWPAQKVMIPNNMKAATANDAEKAKIAAENAPLAKKAVFASRFNTWASIPMLFGMVFGAHGGFAQSWGDLAPAFFGFGIIMFLMIYYANIKPKAAK